MTPAKPEALGALGPARNQATVLQLAASEGNLAALASDASGGLVRTASALELLHDEWLADSAPFRESLPEPAGEESTLQRLRNTQQRPHANAHANRATAILERFRAQAQKNCQAETSTEKTSTLEKWGRRVAERIDHEWTAGEELVNSVNAKFLAMLEAATAAFDADTRQKLLDLQELIAQQTQPPVLVEMSRRQVEKLWKQLRSELDQLGDDLDELCQGLGNLETDWARKLSLTLSERARALAAAQYMAPMSAVRRVQDSTAALNVILLERRRAALDIQRQARRDLDASERVIKARYDALVVEWRVRRFEHQLRAYIVKLEHSQRQRGDAVTLFETAYASWLGCAEAHVRTLETMAVSEALGDEYQSWQEQSAVLHAQVSERATELVNALEKVEQEEDVVMAAAKAKFLPVLDECGLYARATLEQLMDRLATAQAQASRRPNMPALQQLITQRLATMRAGFSVLGALRWALSSTRHNQSNRVSAVYWQQLEVDLSAAIQAYESDAEAHHGDAEALIAEIASEDDDVHLRQLLMQARATLDSDETAQNEHFAELEGIVNVLPRGVQTLVSEYAAHLQSVLGIRANEEESGAVEVPRPVLRYFAQGLSECASVYRPADIELDLQLVLQATGPLARVGAMAFGPSTSGTGAAAGNAALRKRHGASNSLPAGAMRSLTATALVEEANVEVSMPGISDAVLAALATSLQTAYRNDAREWTRTTLAAVSREYEQQRKRIVNLYNQLFYAYEQTRAAVEAAHRQTLDSLDQARAHKTNAARTLEGRFVKLRSNYVREREQLEADHTRKLAALSTKFAELFRQAKTVAELEGPLASTCDRELSALANDLSAQLDAAAARFRDQYQRLVGLVASQPRVRALIALDFESMATLPAKHDARTLKLLAEVTAAREKLADERTRATAELALLADIKSLRGALHVKVKAEIARCRVFEEQLEARLQVLGEKWSLATADANADQWHDDQALVLHVDALKQGLIEYGLYLNCLGPRTTDESAVTSGSANVEPAVPRPVRTAATASGVATEAAPDVASLSILVQTAEWEPALLLARTAVYLDWLDEADAVNVSVQDWVRQGGVAPEVAPAATEAGPQSLAAWRTQIRALVQAAQAATPEAAAASIVARRRLRATPLKQMLAEAERSNADQLDFELCIEVARRECRLQFAELVDAHYHKDRQERWGRADLPADRDAFWTSYDGWLRAVSRNCAQFRAAAIAQYGSLLERAGAALVRALGAAAERHVLQYAAASEALWGTDVRALGASVTASQAASRELSHSLRLVPDAPETALVDRAVAHRDQAAAALRALAGQAEKHAVDRATLALNALSYVLWAFGRIASRWPTIVQNRGASAPPVWVGPLVPVLSPAILAEAVAPAVPNPVAVSSVSIMVRQGPYLPLLVSLATERVAQVRDTHSRRRQSLSGYVGVNVTKLDQWLLEWQREAAARASVFG